MSPAPDAKQVTLGMIPANWGYVSLDDVAKRGSGHTPDKKHPEYWNGNIKWVSLADSNALDNGYITETAASITPAGIANSSAILHPSGTVILSRDAGVGKSAILQSEMAVSQHFMAWQCGPKLERWYLYYWLQAAKPEFERIADGTTIKTIGLPYFKALTIPLPSVREQRAIAEALSDVDALIESLDQLIAKKRNVKQAAMQQLLNGQRRLPGFSREWDTIKACDLGRFRGGTGFPLSSQGRSAGTYPFYKVSDMNNEGNETFMTKANNYVLERTRKLLGATAFASGSIVFAKVGAAVFLERKRILAMPSCIDNNMMAWELDSSVADVRFVHSRLQLLKLSALVASTALPSINARQLGEITIRLPRLPEQIEIARVVSDMESEIAALELRRDKTRALKQGMMQELLTGRTRLI